jgi:hypothetical protein
MCFNSINANKWVNAVKDMNLFQKKSQLKILSWLKYEISISTSVLRTSLYTSDITAVAKLLNQLLCLE